jgi:hypothetical protein
MEGRAVAVGALDHQVVRLAGRLRVAREHGAVAPDVAAEQHAHVAPGRLQLDERRGRPEQVAGVAKREPQAAGQQRPLRERHGPEQRERFVHVRFFEQRQRRRVLGERLPVQVGGVLLLQLGGVEQQDLGQLAGRRRAVDRGREALAHQPRHAADVVEVGVRQHQRGDAARVELGLGPVALPQRLLALEQPAVDEQPRRVRLQQVLRARDGARGAEEAERSHQREAYAVPHDAGAAQSGRYNLGVWGSPSQRRASLIRIRATPRRAGAWPRS